MEVNAAEGYVSMDYEVANEQLGGDLIPEGMSINGDGSITVQVPEQIQLEFNADSGSYTLSQTPENFNINEVPEFVEASYGGEGNIQISFPEGVEYDAEAGTLNLSNEFVNQIAPEPIEISSEGDFQINLPDDTQYFEEGFVISAESADFLDQGGPESENYQNEQYQQAG